MRVLVDASKRFVVNCEKLDFAFASNQFLATSHPETELCVNMLNGYQQENAELRQGSA